MMIDLHCHILPDIDDGAKNMETSIGMCRIALENGVNHIVATPHTEIICDIDEFLQLRNKKIDELRSEIKKNNLNVSIYPGAEVYVDDDVFFASGLEKLTINNSRYLLVEFQFGGIPVRKIVSYLNEIIDMGLVPVIAHPERYEFFQYDYDAINMLAQNGVYFQLNAASLASLDGPHEFALAYAMAYNGVASFIGTDGHSNEYRMNNLGEMMEMFPPDISQYNMQNMVHDSAKCVLLDKELPPIDREPIYRRNF